MKLLSFKRNDNERLRELELATLQGLMETGHSDLSPEEMLSQLMEIGNRELRGEGSPRLVPPSRASKGPPHQPAGRSTEEAPDDEVGELSMADLARLLEA